jgi:hypothetical protein
MTERRPAVAVLAAILGWQVGLFLGYCLTLAALCAAWTGGIFVFKSILWALLFAAGATWLLGRAARADRLAARLRQAGFHAPWFALANGAVHLLLILLFLILVPVVVDRSLSGFLLGTMARAGGTLSGQELRERLVDDYVDRYGAVDRRMVEQIASGNVEPTPDGAYRLTSRGRLVLGAMRFVAGAFSLDRRLVDGAPAGGRP